MGFTQNDRKMLTDTYREVGEVKKDQVKIKDDLKHHISRTDELQAYVEENDNISAASAMKSSKSSMQVFMWIMGILSTIMLFMMGLNFEMFRDIWKMLY